MIASSLTPHTNEVHQCRSCPWRVDCVPDRDIPNGYSRELHEGLRSTIAVPGSVFATNDAAMACHYSKVGEEFVCAGWLYHQIGDGNSIQARMNVMRGRLPVPRVDGQQHRTFDATLENSEAHS